MKATIDIPDEIYRKVKAKSAIEGRRIRDVTVALYQRWLSEGAPGRAEESPEAWLRSWLALADESLNNAPPGPSAREILSADRNRLEPP